MYFGQIRNDPKILKVMIQKNSLSKDVEFFNTYEKFFRRYPPTQTSTQKRNGFSLLGFREVGSTFISFAMIFEALPSSFKFPYHSLSLKILKIPEFNLVMDNHGSSIRRMSYDYGILIRTNWYTIWLTVGLSFWHSVGSKLSFKNQLWNNFIWLSDFWTNYRSGEKFFSACVYR